MSIWHAHLISHKHTPCGVALFCKSNASMPSIGARSRSKWTVRKSAAEILSCLPARIPQRTTTRRARRWMLFLMGVVYVLTATTSATQAGQTIPGIDIIIEKMPSPRRTTVGLGQGGLPVVPADFFGPGSLPFDGPLDVNFNPFLLNRTTASQFDLQNPSTIPTELLQLTLTSNSPIEPVPGSTYDVQIAMEGAGQLSLLETNPAANGAGQLVDSFFDVNYQIQFFPQGATTVGILTLTGAMVLQFAAPDPMELVPWTNLLPNGGLPAGGGNFVLGSDGIQLNEFLLRSPDGGFSLPLVTAVPEPTTAGLFMYAAAALLWRYSRGKHVRSVTAGLLTFAIGFSVSDLSAALITVPTSLSPGDHYRLAFVTSTTRDAASTVIADYNTFVHTTAMSVPALQALGTTWTAIGSTAAVDARDNTGTNPTVSAGEPIFLLNDTLIATNYADLWDSTLLAPLNFTEMETTRTGLAWTGTNGFGLKDPFGLTLGSSIGVELGSVSSTTGSWIGAGFSPTNTGLQPLYAISGVLAVVPEPQYLSLASLVIVSPLYSGLRRRARDTHVATASPLARVRQTNPAHERSYRAQHTWLKGGPPCYAI